MGISEPLFKGPATRTSTLQQTAGAGKGGGEGSGIISFPRFCILQLLATKLGTQTTRRYKRAGGRQRDSGLGLGFRV